MIDLEWYGSFLAVYRAGTVSKAAQSLFLTQPAVTQHLSSLEREVGEQLFTRTARRMIPTARGKALYQQVVQALETLERVSDELQSPQSELPLVRCGAPLEYFSEVVVKRINLLPYRLWFQFGETQTLVEELEREQLDIVIATQQAASRDVEYHKIDSERFYLVSGPGLELPIFDEVGQEERVEQIEQWLATQHWVSYSAELPIIRRFWLEGFGKRPEFQVAAVIPNLHAIRRAIQETNALSVLPDYLCREAIETGRLQVLWEPHQPVTNDLWLAYRKVDRNDTKIKRAREVLRKGT